MTADANTPDLCRLYRNTQQRLCALLSGLGQAELMTPVPACPGWAVRDVLAHLTAISEDALAGRLTGPPSEEHTAAQVARFAGHDTAGMLALWDEFAPQFAQLIASSSIWPAVIDVASHEQDIRGALGRPGARDDEVVWHCADQLLRRLESPVPIRVRVEDAEIRVGPQPAVSQDAEPEAGAADRSDRSDRSGEAGLALETSRFEAFRWRMGRRSRAQLAALAWSGDPAPVLNQLTIFSPADRDIHE
jgi:uncharacterized protein (TIGR03083 family)